MRYKPCAQRVPLEIDPGEQKQLADMHATVSQLSQSRRYVEALPVARQAVALVRLKLAPGDPGNIEPCLIWAASCMASGTIGPRRAGRVFSIDEYREAQTRFDTALTLKRKAR